MKEEEKDYSREDASIIQKYERRKERMETEQEAQTEKFKKLLAEALADESTRKNLVKEAYTATQTPGKPKDLRTGFGGVVFSAEDAYDYKDE